MATYEVDPISRIEGHLGVEIEETGGFVTGANVHGNLWRGFENFLLNRDVNDAITFTQRICGVCPVPHGQVSTYAVDAVLGYSRGHQTFAGPDASGWGVPAKAVHIRNLVLSEEFLMTHLTHFYHLVVLDYVQGPATPPWTPFFNDGFYNGLLQNPVLGSGYNGAYDVSGAAAPGALPNVLSDASGGYSDSLWSAGVLQYVKALRIRRLTFEAGALFAGRMPMTSCFVGGGVTNDGTENLSDRVDTYREITKEIQEFIIKEHVPLVMALGALYPSYDNSGNAATLNTVGLYPGYVAGNRNTYGFGAGYGNFLAWGAFPDGDGDTLGLPGGVVIGTVATGGTAAGFTAANKAEVYDTFLGDDSSANSMWRNLTESIEDSRYVVSEFDTDVYGADNEAYPGAVQRTQPNRLAGYSYIKAPRWAGNPCEVGPFARMVVGGFYPVDGSNLVNAADVTYALPPIAAAIYTKTNSSANTGLNPAAISPDLAVALVRDGLAQLETGASGSGIYDPTGQTKAQIGAAYFGTETVIKGTIWVWFSSMVGGLSTMDRLRGRALEALYLSTLMIGLPAIDGSGNLDYTAASGWIDSAALLTTASGSTWRSKTPPTTATNGWGAGEAPRGALAHFCSRTAEGKISAYQCVVPTTWNASPKDADENNGPMEEAMMDIPYNAAATSSFIDVSGNTVVTQSGLEALRVAHTFDPCIACAVH